MATHSSVLAWRIRGTGEPGGLLSVGLHWVGHNWSNLAAAPSSLLPSELSGVWRGSKIDFINVQIDQIDTGKGTPLQRSFSNLLPTLSHVPKSKVPREGNHGNVSQWFVKAPLAGPHLFLFPLLSKAALRGIYMAGIVPSFLNFPYLTPVSMRECYLLQRGIFRGLTPLFFRIVCRNFSFSFALLHFRFSFTSVSRSFTFEPHVGHHLLRPAQQLGIKSGWRAVWEKETGDRIKVLKMGLGDSRPLGSRALFLGATSLLFSVLASRKYLLCYNEVSLLCPCSRLPFYWLL